MRPHGQSAEIPELTIHIHLIGVCGTGMGAFAGLLKQAGHHVTGSDSAFYPPMGDALEQWGIDKREGYGPQNLSPRPDLVVVGNVCRRDNPEARAAIDGGLEYTSFPGALSRMFLRERRPFVVTGTHGKTTTSAMLAFLLDRAGLAPGFLVGGIAGDFSESFRTGTAGGPFVVEGDEYDSAFFEKSPKFWQYRPEVACIHAIEHDHIDIYPDMESYRNAFARFVELIPTSGLLVINAADPEVRAMAARAACRVVAFALADEDTGGARVDLRARLTEASEAGQAFEIILDDQVRAHTHCPLSGGYNVKNALAAIAMAHLGADVPLETLARTLPDFRGVRRRQELRGSAGGVRVYDDFAHHPTAVAATLAGLRARHPQGRLIAIFEPRSATASRNLHQARYPAAFAAADLTLLAPVGRAGIDDAEKLDVAAIAREINTAGGRAEVAGAGRLSSDTGAADADAEDPVDAIIAQLLDHAREGDTVVAMSNGAFGDIHARLLARLAAR